MDSNGLTHTHPCLSVFIRGSLFGLELTSTVAVHPISQALSDPTVRFWYLLFCFALLVLPMVALAAWYHSTIRKGPGGRALMKRQTETPPLLLRGPVGAIYNLLVAGRMARHIAAGNYGDVVRRTQHQTYLLVALWLILNVIAFGILIWADEVNRGTAP